MVERKPKHRASHVDHRRDSASGDVLKVDGNWRDAVGRALRKEKPAEGWPERQVKKRKRGKKKAPK